VQSAPEPVTLATVAPGLFAYGTNRAAVLNQDFSLNAPGNAASRGTFIMAYLTGQGLVSPPVATGQAAPLATISYAAGTASAAIGGAAATVSFIGLAPGFVGLGQANILVPAGAPSGDQVLAISIDGQAANTALVSIR
jgi:uncharacterized protein (TIGR03437 family)